MTNDNTMNSRPPTPSFMSRVTTREACVPMLDSLQDTLDRYGRVTDALRKALVLYVTTEENMTEAQKTYHDAQDLANEVEDSFLKIHDDLREFSVMMYDDTAHPSYAAVIARLDEMMKKYNEITFYDG